MSAKVAQGSSQHSGVTELAGDGTVIQAAASRYRTLKREALDRKLVEATQQAEQQPDDADKAARRAKYAAADTALAEREAKRDAKGKPTESLRVSTTEPNATIQPLKNKSFAPSYKPSVLANPARVIVGQTVDPSDEIAVVSVMLDQAESIGGGSVERLMLDGNYCNETILKQALAREIDLLCPAEGKAPKERSKLVKSSCSLRPQCFSAKSTRRVIRRLAIDEAKDALRAVMEQPQAQATYGKRKTMVEPVFAFLSGVMNLRRFRRDDATSVAAISPPSPCVAAQLGAPTRVPVMNTNKLPFATPSKAEIP